MINSKLQALKDLLNEYGSIAVAFSGGVDSTLLLKVAKEVLGDNCMAITVRSSTFSSDEYSEAVDFIEEIGVKYEILKSNEFEIEEFRNNIPERCYFCKREIFSNILKVANNNGIKYVADGSNMDDLNDYRPGMKALKELNIVSPLKQVGLTKAEIRELSKEYGLKTWDKPVFACLASRIPYGEEITREKLARIEKAEKILRQEGFKQIRVRHHGDLARIEVLPCDRVKFFDTDFMDRIADQFKSIGYAYTALDLTGYRTGSMNETLQGEKS